MLGSVRFWLVMSLRGVPRFYRDDEAIRKISIHLLRLGEVRMGQYYAVTSTTASAAHKGTSLRSFQVGLLADFYGVNLFPCILDCRFYTGLPLRVFKHPVVNSTRWQSQLAPFSTHLLGYLKAFNVKLNGFFTPLDLCPQRPKTQRLSLQV